MPRVSTDVLAILLLIIYAAETILSDETWRSQKREKQNMDTWPEAQDFVSIKHYDEVNRTYNKSTEDVENNNEVEHRSHRIIKRGVAGPDGFDLGVTIDLGLGGNNQQTTSKGLPNQNTLPEDIPWRSKEPCLFYELVCTGPFANVSIADPENCMKYFICNGIQLFPMSCPNGQKFNYILIKCMPASQVPPNQCQVDCDKVKNGSKMYKDLIVTGSDLTTNGPLSSGTSSAPAVTIETTTTSTTSQKLDVTSDNEVTTKAIVTSAQIETTASTQQMISSTSDSVTSSAFATSTTLAQTTQGDTSLTSTTSQSSSVSNVPVVSTSSQNVASPSSNSVSLSTTTSQNIVVSSTSTALTGPQSSVSSTTASTTSTSTITSIAIVPSTTTTPTTTPSTTTTPTTTSKPIASTPTTTTTTTSKPVVPSTTATTTATTSSRAPSASQVSSTSSTSSSSATSSSIRSSTVDDVGQSTTAPSTTNDSIYCSLPVFCSLNTTIADPENCHGYYTCVKYPEETENRWLSLDCPPGQTFNQSSESCSPNLSNNNCINSCRTAVVHTVFASNGSTTEGKEFEIICSFQVRFTLRQIQVDSFRWFLNGDALTVNMQRSKRFRTIENAPDRLGVWTSTLQIDPLTSRDSGTFTCQVNYGGMYQSSQSTSLQITLLPNVLLTPATLTTFNAENVSLVCLGSYPSETVQPAGRRIVLEFDWFLNDQLLSSDGTMTSITTDQQADTSSLMLTVLNSSLVHCSVRLANTDASRDSEDCAIRMINGSKDKPETAVCRPQLIGSILWSLTAANDVNIEMCSKPLIGKATRKCDSNGNWQQPDYSSCVTNSLNKIISEIDEVEDGIGVSNSTKMAAITSELKDYVSSLLNSSDNESFFNKSDESSGEVINIIESIKRLADVRTQYPEPIQQSEIADILQTVDIVLGPEFANIWQYLNTTDSFSAVSLMKSVDVYAMLWAHNLTEGQDANMTTESFVVQVAAKRRSSSSNITYPRDPMSVVDWWSGTGDRITLFENNTAGGDPSNDIQYITNVYYKNLHEMMPNNYFINSRIMSMAADPLSRDNITVSLLLHINKPFDSTYKRNCDFWDYNKGKSGEWSGKGCSVVSEGTNETHTMCQCNHLTNFAILMSPFTDIDPRTAVILSLISLVGCIVSIISMTMTIVLYAMRWSKVKSHHAVVIINLCIALIIANIIFLAGVNRTQSEVGCKVVAALLHYFFLASFFIMLAEGVQLVLYVIFVFHQRRKTETALLLFAAWFIPMVIVGVSLGITRTEGYGANPGKSDSCWLSLENGVFWAFAGPALCVICINLIIFILVLRRICIAKMRILKDSARDRIKETMWNIMAITPVLGIMWIFGVLSVNKDLIAFQYIFAVANSLQGLFIFIFHGLCNQRNNKNRYSLKTSKGKKISSKPPLDTKQLNKDDITVVINPSDHINRHSLSPRSHGDMNPNGRHNDNYSSTNGSSSESISHFDSDFQSIGTGTTFVNSDSGTSREGRKRNVVSSQL